MPHLPLTAPMPRTDDFDYHLPEELIADRPPERRDGARMLVVDRQAGSITHSPAFHGFSRNSGGA